MPDKEQGSQKGGLSWSTPQAPSSTELKPIAKPEKPSTPILPATTPAFAVPITSAGTYAGLLAGGIVIGVLLAWGFGALRGGVGAGIATSTAQGARAAQNAQVPDPNATGLARTLVLPSPQDAGLTVAITTVALERPTWLVVQETSGGKPGSVLGAALFFPDTKGGSIRLLRSMRAGQTYYVGERTDNGDKKFTLAADSQVTDEAGNVQWVAFVAK